MLPYWLESMPLAEACTAWQASWLVHNMRARRCCQVANAWHDCIQFDKPSKKTCLETSAIVATKAQVQLVVHDHTCICQGKVALASKHMVFHLTCTVITVCAEMQAWGCHICGSTPPAVATTCTVLQLSEDEVIDEARRPEAEDKKHKKQAAIAAKAALHHKVRTHNGDNQQGTLSAICLAYWKFVCTSDLVLIWYFCTNSMHSFIVATTPKLMKSFQDITMLCV